MEREVLILLTLLAAVLASPPSKPQSWYIESASGKACPPDVTCHNLSTLTSPASTSPQTVPSFSSQASMSWSSQN